jgi:carboxymethylenebutenolidase
MLTLNSKTLIRTFSIFTLSACTSAQVGSTSSSTPATSTSLSSSSAVTSPGSDLPPDADSALSRLNRSPRHGEWAMVSVSPSDSIRAWIVYPERKTKAPVVVVIHEIYGLSTWIRAVTDQLAADGFIAVAPDLLTKVPRPAGSDTLSMQDAVAAIRTLDPSQVQRQIDAVARYAMALPAAQPRYGIVGFCWGGGVSFAHATHSPSLGASVVYYGVAPTTESLSMMRAPVLGLYGGNDARVDATIPAADSAIRALGKTYSHSVFDGAGHGFLRQQTGMNGANMKATQQAWPATIAWFRKYIDS